MTKPDHRYCGYHADELIKGLQRLARKHKNGAKIIEAMKVPTFTFFDTFKAHGMLHLVVNKDLDEATLILFIGTLRL